MGGRVALLAALLGAAGCAADRGGDPLDFPSSGGGKADAFGRSLAGVAAPYPADPGLADEATTAALRRDMKLRRDTAWATAIKVLEPVPLLGLVEVLGEHPEVSWPDPDVPTVPRFETWYGVDDVKRMFAHLYEGLGPDGRAAKAPLSAAAIADAVVWNVGAAERSDRWPLERYLAFVAAMGACPDGESGAACDLSVESQIGGGVVGTTRVLYSPSVVDHLLGDYRSATACLDRLGALGLDAEPADAANFTACFAGEMPADAALVKAQWVRADLDPALPAFDTDAAALGKRLGGTALWPEAGDRTREPGADEIYTIRLHDGSVFRLAGLHIMTKELRHWQWVTLWWSDLPDADFGADRPAGFAALPAVWSRYKMCAVTWFDEEDPALAERYAALPSLAAALSATAGEPSWCSNPYIEHGRGNARTNCIGCHQHGGSTVAHDLDGDGALDPLDLGRVIDDEVLFPDNGRREQRAVFPADYTYSFNRQDDLAHVLAQEIEFQDALDAGR